MGVATRIVFPKLLWDFLFHPEGQLSQDVADRPIYKFSGLVDIHVCMQMNDLTFAQGTLLWQLILGRGKIEEMCVTFIALAFQNGLEDRNADARRLNGNDLSTLCRNLTSFRPVPWSLRG